MEGRNLSIPQVVWKVGQAREDVLKARAAVCIVFGRGHGAYSKYRASLLHDMFWSGVDAREGGELPTASHEDRRWMAKDRQSNAGRVTRQSTVHSRAEQSKTIENQCGR